MKEDKKEEVKGRGESSQDIDRPGKIMVAGLPRNSEYSESDLETEFAVFGRITEVYIIRDRRNRDSRGFAFITYENPKDAADAMKAMEGKDLGGDRRVHCEQAVLGSRKSEDGSKGRGGRGRGRGEGRGGRGEGRGGRGGDRDWRGGRGGGDRGRGEFRGGCGMRGQGDGMRGRGRSDYFEPGMQDDGYYGRHEQGPPRGMPSRRTLLPSPGLRGGPMMRGGNEYYNEGPERFRQDGYYDDGMGGYNEGYDEAYQEEHYYDQESYHNERMPQRGGRGGPLLRGGRGMAYPPEGGRMPREEAEFSLREENYPPRHGVIGGGRGDYGGRGSGMPRRGGPGPSFNGRGRENPPEDYLAPSRRAADEYGYSADDGLGTRRQEAPRRAMGGQYTEEDFDFESRQRRAENYEDVPRGRSAPGGRGAPPLGRGASAQRRAPLLGHDPYAQEEYPQEYYDTPRDRFQEESFSNTRAAQPPNRRRADESYEYDVTPSAHDDGFSQRRAATAGSNRFEENYLGESRQGMRMRDDYSGMRPTGMRRPDMDYSSRREELSHGNTEDYSSFAGRPREMASDLYNRKRPMDYEETPEVRRDYGDYYDRAGPTGPKRDRHEGFYQARQEEVYREL